MNSEALAKAGKSTSAQPKYQRLFELLEADIQNQKHPSGSLFPSEHELSRLFNLSRHTVRAALAHLERQGYLIRMRGKGTFVQYPPVRPDAPKGEIGMLVPCVTIALYPEVVRGVEDVVSAAGRHLILGCYDVDPGKERLYITRMLEKPVAGIILCPSYNSSATLYQGLVHCEMPFILVDTAVDGVDADLVATNGFEGARQGVLRLAAAGCTRPAFVSGYLAASTSRERLAGFRAGLDEAGLPCPEERILAGGFDEAFGRTAARALLALPQPPDGILIANDPIAAGLVAELQAAGIAPPEGMRLCVFDEPGIPLHLRVPMDLIRQPRRLIGETAARLLLERIDLHAHHQPAPPPRLIRLPPETAPV